MALYRKKPVVIEAVQFQGFRSDRTPVLAPSESPPAWLTDAIVRQDIRPVSDGSGAVISTLEGSMGAKIGDWIVRGVRGELYPCKPDIFAETYEAAE